MRRYWIYEKSNINCYTTFNLDGKTTNVEIKKTRIGPFESLPMCADYLSNNAVKNTDYSIEEEVLIGYERNKDNENK